ncbi:hypothetical protein O9G_003972 [Rozella allomycis CSF55]|uniref:Uncharacterized protein n=1 Tax=Rozella allomycis (strain CSF55) TaxID=988480 RepID=A0A075AZ67_ROZAC|nr:hypothetical protein O9G_003972 [Rozella allomycis CSF55]|eukprot:EPZ33864.1 hypothetical protein O9G_003972 [Rozella allomycis CSF55]
MKNTIEQREKEIRFELKTMTPFSIYCTSEDDCSCLKNIITGKMEELVNRKEVEDTVNGLVIKVNGEFLTIMP